MTKGFARFIHLLLVASLLATPSNAAPCPGAKNPGARMSCCDSTCPCPAEKTCAAPASSSGERLVSPAAPQLFHRPAILLYAFKFERETSSRASVELAPDDPGPPPAMAGSPPQARLRVWIL